MWIAVSCYVKLFPNLEAALKGVFNRVLTTLHLNHNQIGAEGAITIAEALKVNAVLTTLFLFSNEIGDEGAKAIAQALKVNAVLKNLRKASASTRSSQENCREGKKISPFVFQSRASRRPLRSSMLWSSCQNELDDDTGDALRTAAQPGFPIDL